MWLCRCDCGNEILLERYKIERELVHSCGCSRTSSIDLTGKKIGKLTVIRKLNEKRVRIICGYADVIVEMKSKFLLRI